MVKLKNRGEEIDVDDLIQKAALQASKTMADSMDTVVEKRLSQKLADIKNMHNPNDDISCPTCNIGHNGHSHKLKNNGTGRLVCTGPECQEQYHLISANPDVQCENCGVPLKRPPKELENSLTCPLCGKDHFREFNKKKIKR